MSLIHTRRKRKKSWLDTRKGMPMGRLMLLLIVVVGAIWYLGWRF